MESINSSKPLNFREACAYLNYAEGTLYKLTSARMIPFSRPNNGRIYFDKNDLDNWLLRNKTVGYDENRNAAATYVTTHKQAS